MSNQFYCNRCGGLFNCSPKARPTWCDDCRKQEQKEYQAEYYKRRKSELDRLRAVNAELVRALKGCVSWMEEHHQMPSYSEKIYIARAALSRAEQAEPETETCVWTYYPTGIWDTSCGNGILGLEPMTKCPFCGKRVEVTGKDEGRKEVLR